MVGNATHEVSRIFLDESWGEGGFHDLVALLARGKTLEEIEKMQEVGVKERVGRLKVWFGALASIKTCEQSIEGNLSAWSINQIKETCCHCEI